MKIPSMEQKIQETFLLFQVIAFERGTANPENPQIDSSHQ